MYAERCVVPCPSHGCPIRPSTLSTHPYLNHDDPSNRNPVGWSNGRESTRAATHLETTQNSHQSRPTAAVLYFLLVFSPVLLRLPRSPCAERQPGFLPKASKERETNRKRKKKPHYHTPIQAPRALRSIASLFAQSEPNRTAPAVKMPCQNADSAS